MNAPERTDGSLREIADAISRRDVSCIEVTQACLDRAKKLQPKLNCFIQIDDDLALSQARAADDELARGQARSPLHGVPMAHKDAFYRRGRVSTCGSKIRADFVPDVTATTLQRLDEAGAVDLGTLHLGEFAASGTGHNAHYGDCENPWNGAYTPGGSSSGSAVAVAARIAFASLGTDTSGSLRWPAFLCGVVALRPTKGRVSGHGVLARSWTIDAVGPMARTVEDVAAVYAAIAGHDSLDPESIADPVPDIPRLRAGDIAGLKIGIPDNYFYEGVAADVGRALDDCHRIFEWLGAKLVSLPMPDPGVASELCDLIVKCESSAIHQDWLRERPEDYSTFVRAQLIPGFFVPAPAYIQALRIRAAQLAKLVATTFGEVDVLLVPGAPVSPPTLEQMDLQSAEDVQKFWATVPRCTRPISFWGLPALSVPCGFSSAGIPVGFQLVGPPNAEAALLHAGHAYQSQTDWHLRSPAL